MITLLTGGNSFEAERELQRVVATFGAAPERFDGSELELRQLPDLLSGMSLFSEQRLVIIRGLTANKQAWEALPAFLERMSNDVHLVLVEPALDKRTKTYKMLQKLAEVKDSSFLTERDGAKAERWLAGEAARLGVKLEGAAAKLLIRRALVPAEKGPAIIDQWRLLGTLEKLSVFEAITPAVVESYTEEQPIESVFGLLETALQGNRAALGRLLDNLETREDPFKVSGLLASQAFQLATLAVSDWSFGDVAKDIGAPPFALQKLAPLAKRVGVGGARRVVAALAEADEAVKTSKGAPWLLIRRALMKIATPYAT